MTSKDSQTLLSRDQRVFLIFSNIIVAGTIVLDLFFITNILVFPLESFTLFNLIVLGIALFSYRIKRRVNEELAKARASKKEEPTA